MLFNSNRARAVSACVAVFLLILFLFVFSESAAILNTVYLARPVDLEKITHDLNKEDVRRLLGEPFAQHDFDRGDGCWIYSYKRNGLMRWESVRVCFDSFNYVIFAGSNVF